MEKARSPTQHLCNLSTVPLLLHELHSIGNTEAQLGAFVLDLLKIAVVDPKQSHEKQAQMHGVIGLGSRGLRSACRRHRKTLALRLAMHLKLGDYCMWPHVMSPAMHALLNSMTTHDHLSKRTLHSCTLSHSTVQSPVIRMSWLAMHPCLLNKTLSHTTVQPTVIRMSLLAMHPCLLINKTPSHNCPTDIHSECPCLQHFHTLLSNRQSLDRAEQLTRRSWNRKD